MASQNKEDNQEPFDYIGLMEAHRIANAALNSGPDEPDDFVRALLPILDRTTDHQTADAIGFLIDGAFYQSLAFCIARDEYVDSIRRGGNPTQEWRARKYGSGAEEGAGIVAQSEQATAAPPDYQTIAQALAWLMQNLPDEQINGNDIKKDLQSFLYSLHDGAAIDEAEPARFVLWLPDALAEITERKGGDDHVS